MTARLGRGCELAGLAVSHDRIVDLVGAPRLQSVNVDIEKVKREVVSRGEIHLSGVAINAKQFASLLSVLPLYRGGRVVSSVRLESVMLTEGCNLSGLHVKANLSLRDCIVSGGIDLSGMAAWGEVTFERVSFLGDLEIERAKFRQAVNFKRCRFSGHLKAADAIFMQQVSFTSAERPAYRLVRRGSGAVHHFQPAEGVVGCISEGLIDFSSCTFYGPLIMAENVFMGSLDLTRARLRSGGSWNRSSFRGSATFNRARFQGPATFAGAEFTLEELTPEDRASFKWSPVEFFGAIFARGLNFSCLVRGHASFRRVRVSGDAAFTDAQFQGGAQFNQSRWDGNTSFHMASFDGSGDFLNAAFVGPVTFSSTQFGTYTRFFGVKFLHKADFRFSTSAHPVSFERAQFSGQLSMFRCGWDERLDFSSAVISCARVNLSEARFGRYVQLAISSPMVDLRRAQFSAGGQVHLGAGSEVTLEDADILAPLIVAALTLNPGGRTPQILSVRRTNAENISFEGVSLSRCLFFGAVNLDKLRIGGGVEFGEPPKNRLLWTRREVAMEEVLLRRSARGGEAWSAPSTWTGDVVAATPSQVSGVYRALRKGREDAKNEPGASDFYYGEMEMRRMGTPPWSFERALLWGYWASSGYALRATRAFLLLLVVLGACGVGYSAFGFTNPSVTTYSLEWLGGRPTMVSGVRSIPPVGDFLQRLPHALLLSAQTGTSFTRPGAPELTTAGSVLELLNRIFAPLLLGLTVLSLRSRVKR